LLPTPTVPATAAAGSRGGSRWVGRVAAEWNLVPFPGRRPPRLRAESAFRGLAPGHSAWPRSLPVSGERKRPSGFRRFQPGTEVPGPVPFGSGIGANPSPFAIGFRSKQASIFRRERRRGEPPLRPLGFPFGASSSGSACQFLREANPASVPVRTMTEASSGPDPSAFASAGRFPLPFGRLRHHDPRVSGAAGRFLEIQPRIRFRLCWPGFFH
jgi:hypothetical protein